MESIKLATSENTTKFWYGNPENDLIEGSFNFIDHVFTLRETRDQYNELDLNKLRKHIWAINDSNTLLNYDKLCCLINNKITICEFLGLIKAYLNYITIVRIWKSPIPNFYYILLEFKSLEYSNIFFNNFNFLKISSFEKDYLSFYEVKYVSINDEFVSNRKDSISLEKLESDISYDTAELNQIAHANSNDQIDCNNVTCSICLDYIENSSKSRSKLNKVNGIVYSLCGHMYHISCLIKFEEKEQMKCPLCRYTISPSYLSTCAICVVETDLWICLICGVINCGESGDSNNHRKEHYMTTGHRYCKLISDQITYDFQINSTLNAYYEKALVDSNKKIQMVDIDAELYIDQNEEKVKDEEIFKNPFEKVKYLLSEYNSKITSELERQRLYYYKEIRKLEDGYEDEIIRLKEESEKALKEVTYLKEKLTRSNQIKDTLYEDLRKAKQENSNLSSEREIIETKFKEVTNSKNLNQPINYKKEICDINAEITQLKETISDLKLNIITSKRLSKYKNIDNVVGVLKVEKKKSSK